MKTRHIASLLLYTSILASFAGCARFHTTQTDVSRKDDNGETIRTVTTKAAAWTFWESKSTLAKWKAMQTDKTQGAEVGGLDQSASVTTNTVAIVEAVVTGVVRGLGKAVTP